MRQALRWWMVWAAVSACGTDGIEGPGEAPTAGSPSSVPLGFTDRTTEGQVAVANLNSEIDSLTRLVSQPSASVALRVQLIRALLRRTGFSGTYDDFSIADDLSSELMLRAPDDSRTHLARYSVLSAVHRFEEARAALDDALATGAAVDETVRADLTVALALGQAEELEVGATDLLARANSYENLVLAASVAADSGRFTDADSLFIDAMNAYRDVSPFPIARVFFLRGLMWAEMADRPDLAIDLYREAVRRVPGYVVASVHLAELEASAGRLDEARALLEPLVDSGDPEPAGLLSELIQAGEPVLAEELSTQARERYDRLLSEHREAFLDHGAEFFAGPGNDTSRALTLALENVTLRSNARAYVVAIEVATLADDVARACALAREAEPLAARHPVLSGTIESTTESCPR